MSNLHTCICHKCRQFMEFPYQSTVDGELYHEFCLPENKNSDETESEDTEETEEQTS